MRFKIGVKRKSGYDFKVGALIYYKYNFINRKETFIIVNENTDYYWLLETKRDYTVNSLITLLRKKDMLSGWKKHE